MGRAEQVGIVKSPIDRAFEAWGAAHYGEALEHLRGQTDATARLLAARTHIRLKDYQSAYDTIRNLRPSKLEELAEARILRAYLEDRLDGFRMDFDQSPVGLLDLPTGTNLQLRALHQFYRASCLMFRGDHEAAQREAEAITPRSNALLKAWNSELRGYIECTRGQFRAAVDHFIEALTILESGSAQDEHKRVNALHGLAICAVETMDQRAFPLLQGGAKTIQLLDTFVDLSTRIKTYAGLSHAIQGNDELAFLALNDALVSAKVSVVSALPHIELASFHKRRGSSDAAVLHLKVARHVLDSIDWSAQSEDARLLPMLYASEAADLDHAAASQFYTKALNGNGKADPAVAFHKDKRASALASFAKGRLLRTENKIDGGIDALTTSHSWWREVDYRYRAAISELDLLSLGASVEHPLLPKITRAFPKSWIAAESKARKAQAASPLRQVSAAERKVLEGICEGKTSRQIAEDLGRSPSTVRNQTISLYRLLGVNTRTALVALVKDAEP